MLCLVGRMENKGGWISSPSYFPSLGKGNLIFPSYDWLGKFGGWKTDFSIFDWKDLEDGILLTKFQWVDSSLFARFWEDSKSIDLGKNPVPTDSSPKWISSNQTRLIGAFHPGIHPPVSFPSEFCPTKHNKREPWSCCKKEDLGDQRQPKQTIVFFVWPNIY